MRESYSDVEREVRRIVRDLLDVTYEMITPEADFICDLGADSLKYNELMVRVELDFQLGIPDEDAEFLTNLMRLTEYVYLVEHGRKEKLKERLHKWRNGLVKVS
ncbi:acyl carrier protein [Candidatus Berkelbacteria bacterium]|nr:acyl carrier protein [Candidatus Berkelbacteria bacterium]